MTISAIAFRGDYATIEGDTVPFETVPAHNTPNAAQAGDRLITVFAAFGFDPDFGGAESTDPLITAPSADWAPILSVDGIPGKLVEFDASDPEPGYHTIWMYGWVRVIGSPTELFEWELNGNPNEFHEVFAISQTFRGGQINLTNLRSAVTDQQSNTWNSATAGVPTSLYPGGGTWLMSSFGAMTRLTEPGTGLPPTVTWTTVDSSLGLSLLEDDAGDTGTFGRYRLAGGDAPTSGLASHYNIDDTDLGVEFNWSGWATSTIHGVFFRCRWLFEPGAGDYWGIMVS